MLICHCRAVSDHALQRHLAAGVCRERDLMVRSGAGSRCGGCLPQLRQLLAEQRQISGGLAEVVLHGLDGDLAVLEDECVDTVAAHVA